MIGLSMMSQLISVGRLWQGDAVIMKLFLRATIILKSNVLYFYFWKHFSCSDNGSVVVHTLGLSTEDIKESTVHFNLPVKAVCIEEDSTAKKDKSFIAGSY
jgi:hypothetical protein